jgi:carboxylesterase type B
LVDQTLNVIERLYDFPEGDLTNKTLGYVLESLLELTYVVSEDCLHLSVHTPVDPTAGNLTADLPVMVFIHGGAFMSGSQYMYDHARLGDAADVIVVSVNYRVGPLGFMCLDTVESPGNMGMIDQVLGLRWVQDNIDKFGGDKNRVIMLFN